MQLIHGDILLIIQKLVWLLSLKVFIIYQQMRYINKEFRVIVTLRF